MKKLSEGELKLFGLVLESKRVEQKWSDIRVVNEHFYSIINEVTINGIRKTPKRSKLTILEFSLLRWSFRDSYECDMGFWMRWKFEGIELKPFPGKEKDSGEGTARRA